MKNTIIKILSLVAISTQFSCTKFIAADTPRTQISSDLVFSDDKTANSAVAGMYSNMYGLNNSLSTFGGFHTTICAALSADELVMPATPTNAFYTHSLLPGENNISNLWQSCYTSIFAANSVIEGVSSSTGMSEASKKQFIAEARFVRAFSYFYLINFFGDVPLIKETDISKSAVATRSSTKDIYATIVDDLKMAQADLSADYSYAAGERIRVNKSAATAFLARVYLFLSEWANAETEATAVISQSSLYKLATDINTTFYKNSSEAIWQFTSYGGIGATILGTLFIPATASSRPTYTLTPQLLSAFESNDQRRTKWAATYTVSGQTYIAPYKYKNRVSVSGATAEYDMALRLAEQYLIRAEARARQGKVTEGLADLNVIRTRAGLAALTGLNQSSLLSSIEQERRIEFFSEWGHRWFDLKRTGRVDAVLSAVKPNWQSNAALFPIPQVELSRNPNLTQNPGY